MPLPFRAVTAHFGRKYEPEFEARTALVLDKIMTSTDWIAIYAAVLSTVVFLWNLYSYRSANRSRLLIELNTNTDSRNCVCYPQFNITNSGKPSLIISEIGGKHKKTGIYFKSESPLPKELHHGEKVVVTLNVDEIPDWEWLAVRDSLKKIYKIKRADFDNFIAQWTAEEEKLLPFREAAHQMDYEERQERRRRDKRPKL